MSETQDLSTQITSGNDVAESAPKTPSLEDSLREALAAQNPDEKETKTEAAPSEPESEKTVGNTDDVETKPAGDTAPDSKEPPEDWSAEDKTLFKTLTAEGQDFLLRRTKEMQGDYTRKTQELSEVRKFHDDLSPVFKNFDPLLKAHNLSPADAVSRLLNAQYALDTDPEKALGELAKTYGLTVSKPDSEFQDPDMKALEAKYGTRIAELEARLNNQQQTAHATSKADALGRIEAFKSEKDSTGNLKYPHFDRVQESMAKVINSGYTKDLSVAYDKAVRLDDELYAQTLTQRETAAKKARDEEAKQLAAKAKTQQQGNIKGKNTPAPSNKPKTLEEELRSHMT